MISDTLPPKTNNTATVFEYHSWTDPEHSCSYSVFVEFHWTSYFLLKLNHEKNLKLVNFASEDM